MSDENDILQKFELEIARQEDLLYGIALFFECVSLLFAGQAAVLETHRKQFRNIIQSGTTATDRARDLLAEARQDPRKVALVEQFAFRPAEGHPDPNALVTRARALVESYQELFPNRPRDQALTADDTLKLMDAASRKNA